MPGVSIGVPAGYDAYGHGARRRKRMPIADTVARINGGYADDFGRKRHGRPEAETGAGAVGKRRSALQEDSGTHPLLGLIRPFGPPARGQRRRRIAHTDAAGQIARDAATFPQLPPCHPPPVVAPRSPTNSLV